MSSSENTINIASGPEAAVWVPPDVIAHQMPARERPECERCAYRVQVFCHPVFAGLFVTACNCVHTSMTDARHCGLGHGATPTESIDAWKVERLRADACSTPRLNYPPIIVWE